MGDTSENMDQLKAELVDRDGTIARMTERLQELAGDSHQLTKERDQLLMQKNQLLVKLERASQGKGTDELNTENKGLRTQASKQDKLIDELRKTIGQKDADMIILVDQRKTAERRSEQIMGTIETMQTARDNADKARNSAVAREQLLQLEFSGIKEKHDVLLLSTTELQKIGKAAEAAVASLPPVARKEVLVKVLIKALKQAGYCKKEEVPQEQEA